jgi:hypothetical protein
MAVVLARIQLDIREAVRSLLRSDMVLGLSGDTGDLGF